MLRPVRTRTATEVASMSVEEKRLGYASEELWRFRNLVERLAKVNPTELSHNEKLAFWINIYNALIMHAYLAYGIPKTELTLSSLMQKAAYTVGGHSYNAATIEYMTLNMNPPLHRHQIALLLSILKLKIRAEREMQVIRIYSAESVGEELEEAQEDYIHASVGVSPRRKLIVPQMLHCFAKTLSMTARLLYGFLDIGLLAMPHLLRSVFTEDNGGVFSGFN